MVLKGLGSCDRGSQLVYTARQGPLSKSEAQATLAQPPVEGSTVLGRALPR